MHVSLFQDTAGGCLGRRKEGWCRQRCRARAGRKAGFGNVVWGEDRQAGLRDGKVGRAEEAGPRLLHYHKGADCAMAASFSGAGYITRAGTS